VSSGFLRWLGFWNPHLFLRWGFWRFIKNTILDGRRSWLRWSDFGQFGSSGRFLAWFEATALTNLAIEILALLT
jgi:hypothetical protein